MPGQQTTKINSFLQSPRKGYKNIKNGKKTGYKKRRNSQFT